MRVGATNRARAARRNSARPARLLFTVAGAFLLICGLLLLWMAPGGPTSNEDEVVLDREQAMRALDSAQLAERAMDERNYGEARARLREARQTLAGLLHQAKYEAEAADQE